MSSQSTTFWAPKDVDDHVVGSGEAAPHAEEAVTPKPDNSSRPSDIASGIPESVGPRQTNQADKGEDRSILDLVNDSSYEEQVNGVDLQAGGQRDPAELWRMRHRQPGNGRGQGSVQRCRSSQTHRRV